jgi:hypothetical protein
MHLLARRYARSRTAPPWFYAAMAVGFAGLVAYGAIRGDWLVVVLAAAMAAITIAGGRYLRRLPASGADLSRSEDSDA